MHRALISDIHGNLEALEVVLDDIRAQNVTEIICLGDIIGYGPNPRECIDRVMETCKLTLMGNHDAAANIDPPGVSSFGQPVFMVRHPAVAAADEIRRDFLRGLPRSYQHGPFLFVHGSPRNPLNEYIFPEDIYNHRKMERQFELVDRYCFHGHTHVPGIITAKLEFFSPEAINLEYELSDGKVIADIGAVGQPRDGDERACYVILEDGLGVEWPIDSTNRITATPLGTPKVVFRRIEYDLGATIRKIRAG